MSLHVIIGEDDFLVSETAKKHLLPEAELDVIDSVNATNADLQLADLQRVRESYLTPPFLYPAKVTWWKNVGFLPQGGKTGPAEEVKERLEKFAVEMAEKPLPDNQVFLLTGKKLLKTSVFAKKVQTAGELVTFEASKPWEQAKNAVVRVMDLAADMNLKFESGAAEIFVARVGVDSRSLMSELAKMRDFLGPSAHTITAADIAEVTSQGVGVEPEIWAITDALGERNLEKTMAAVARFERENGFAVLVTTVVEKFFRQLVELKDAAERGKTSLATEGMAPFTVKKNMGFLRNWSLLELRVARKRFLDLREKVVSSSGSADVLVAAAIVRTCMRPTRGGAR